MSAPIVRVRGASKQWSAGAGLQGIDLDVTSGELVVVRGRSGSGKSTLLALLAGWCAPDQGTIEFAEGLRPERWADLTIVPQVLGLVGELTVVEHLADAIGIDGRRTRGDGRILRVLDDLGLTDLVERFPGEMSMGQCQRTAVARAIIGDPRIVLADEPTSHQDPANSATVVEALLAAAERGAAVIVATHDPSIVASATRIIDLDGRRAPPSDPADAGQPFAGSGADG